MKKEGHIAQIAVRAKRGKIACIPEKRARKIWSGDEAINKGCGYCHRITGGDYGH